MREMGSQWVAVILKCFVTSLVSASIHKCVQLRYPPNKARLILLINFQYQPLTIKVTKEQMNNKSSFYDEYLYTFAQAKEAATLG